MFDYETFSATTMTDSASGQLGYLICITGVHGAQAWPFLNAEVHMFNFSSKSTGF